MNYLDGGYFYCSNCGARFATMYSICPNCKRNLIPDKNIRAEMERQARIRTKEAERLKKWAEKWTFFGKSKKVAIILWLLSYFGFLQFWAFYLGFYKSAIIRLSLCIISTILFVVPRYHSVFNVRMLLTPASLLLVVLLIWNIIDFVNICKATFAAKNEKY